MQANPFQQRIELIGEKWEEAKTQTDARIVCLQCVPDELEMADAFYTWMIAADTPVYDIGFQFESRCYDLRRFSEALLEELVDVLHIWNNSAKDERIDYVPITWQPDYTKRNDKNPAVLFVENFNRLAAELSLPDDYYAVAIFKGASLDKAFASWLRQAVEAGIATNVKFLLHDVVAQQKHEGIERRHPSLVANIPLNLNMPQAMEQAAAMGDPSDPATTYRRGFMQMINAMGAGKEGEAEKHGQDCLVMATENLSRDPYWIMQLVVINVALGNDKIRYKKKKETVAYAHKAVDAAVAGAAHLDKQSAAALLSQALMFRGSVFYMQSNWSEGYEDFNTAFGLYVQQGNLPLAVEASRMGGQCALKSSQKKVGLGLWAQGVRLGEKMDAETARASTYTMLLKQLLAADHEAVIGTGELQTIAQRVYGNDWATIVLNATKTPVQTSVAEPELSAG